MTTLLKAGQRITVNECDWLGTPEVMGTIRKVYKEHYIVHCDGDDPEWEGPVSFDGDVICDMP